MLNEGLKIYQDQNTGAQYVWDGSQYVDYKKWRKQMQQGGQSGGGSSSNDDDQDQNEPNNGGSSDGNDNDNTSDDNSGDDSSSNGSSGKRSNKKDNKKNQGPPQIGDRGDKDFQDQEEIERAEQAKKDGVIPETKDEFEARMKKIRDYKKDSSFGDKLAGESEYVKDKNNAAKERAEAERQAKRFRESPLYKFKLSLDGFIKRQIDDKREYSWAKMNRTHAGGDILRKGAGMVPTGKIPVMNVYFDRSGSWSENKLKYGRAAIKTLDKYQKEGKLKIRVYYFSDEVFSDYDDPRADRGTHGSDIVRHIKETKPDNVVIMTDDDIDGTDGDRLPDTVVPGAVWYLFKDGKCKTLPEHIRGKQLTREFEM